MKNKSKLLGRDLNYYLEKDDILNNDIRYMPSDIKNELFNKTKACKGSVRERLYWLRNNLSDYPKCSCGKKLSSKQFLTNKKDNGYRSFCSKSCARLDETFKEKHQAKMLEQYGVSHTFKLQEVQNKRKQTNLNKYGREHPHPWGSDEFNKNIINKFGSIQSYVDSNKISVSKGLIKHYIESGKILSIIQNIENKFYVECQNLDEAISHTRIDDKLKLEDLKLTWKHLFCDKEFSMSIVDGNLNVCPHCKKQGTSFLEQDILSSILELAEQQKLTVIHKDRTAIKPKEIDIYLPEIKLGFEVNGIYWHSVNLSDNKNQLINKTQIAHSNDIRIIHIFENQWLNNKQLILDKIKNLMKMHTYKMYARQCIIKEISLEEKNKFLNAHHIQGQDKSSVKLGLYLKDKLVAVMTFGAPRFNKQYDWELIRYCTISNANVLGGFSKLLKYFKQKYCFSGYKIISYRDLSWGINSNNIYTLNNFTLLNMSEPGYLWASNNTFHYLTRYQTQKHKLKNLLGDKFDDNLSESENMKKAGYLKIFTCGNEVYELKVT